VDVEAAAANELIEERRASSRAEVLLRVEMAQAHGNALFVHIRGVTMCSPILVMVTSGIIAGCIRWQKTQKIVIKLFSSILFAC
jgi:FixJ family two-component response regulator